MSAGDGEVPNRTQERDRNDLQEEFLTGFISKTVPGNYSDIQRSVFAKANGTTLGISLPPFKGKRQKNQRSSAQESINSYLMRAFLGVQEARAGITAPAGGSDIIYGIEGRRWVQALRLIGL